MDSFFILNSSGKISTAENYAGFVIFYKKSKDVEIAEIQINLYLKLIENALKLKMENFLFIDVNEHKERFSSLRKSISIQKCFLFGVEESEIGINFKIPMYQLTQFSEIEFLKVDTPELLEQNKNMKNKLWVQLQISFKLN